MFSLSVAGRLCIPLQRCRRIPLLDVSGPQLFRSTLRVRGDAIADRGIIES
jgi:hypothetical protein